MTIPSAKYLKNKAAIRLESGQQPMHVLLWYAGVITGLSLIITLIQYYISTQIANTGGLSSIGMRSILSTISTSLNIFEIVIGTCLGLGYTAAMLRIARRQYASPKTLKAGFERFLPLMISQVLCGLIYAGIGIGLFYPVTGIYLMTPLSNSFVEKLTELSASGNITPETLVANQPLMEELSGELLPMMALYCIIYIPIVLFVSYRYRMVDYIILDNPGCGASAALKQSREMMRGNTIKLFQVDLCFWWYHLLRFLSYALLYCDMILPLFGIHMSGAINVLAPIILYQTAEFTINYFFLNKFAVTHALAYHAIAPRKDDGSAVLGNIFNMQ